MFSQIRVCPFSSLLFRTSGQITGCSKSNIENKIVFRMFGMKTVQMFGTKKYRMFGA
jgi:hypothetical protein